MESTSLKSLLSSANVIFVGLQKSFLYAPDLLLFQQTKNSSTLSVPFNPADTHEQILRAVQRRLKIHNAWLAAIGAGKSKLDRSEVQMLIDDRDPVVEDDEKQITEIRRWVAADLEVS